MRGSIVRRMFRNSANELVLAGGLALIAPVSFMCEYFDAKANMVLDIPPDITSGGFIVAGLFALCGAAMLVKKAYKEAKFIQPPSLNKGIVSRKEWRQKNYPPRNEC